MATQQFVECGDLRPGDEAQLRLKAAGFSPSVVEWLQPIVADPAVPGFDLAGSALDILSRLRKDSSSDEGALLAFLASHAEVLPADRAKLLASRCRDSGLDLPSSFPELISSAQRPQHAPQMAGELVRLGVIAPEQFIDWTVVARFADGKGWRSRTHTAEEEREEDRDIKSLVFWLVADAPSALRVAADHLEKCSLNDLSSEGRAVCFAVQTLMWRRVDGKVVHIESYLRRGEEFARGLERIFRAIWNRTTVLEKEERNRFSPLLLRLHWMSFDGRELDLPEKDRIELVAMADRQIGVLRGLIRTSTVEEAASILERDMDEYRAAVRAIFSSGTLWHGMRAALLLFRALPVPGVSPDLRWWADSMIRENPPSPWCEVTEAMVYKFHAYAGREQESDERLQELREGFARYCLERLKSKKSEPGALDVSQKVEPDPHWRVAYIRALEELGINPGGKGHRILHAAAEQDPDEEVRIAARKAYNSLRHGVDLAEGVSPRRAVLKATWWLRQGHLLALGQEIDKDGALRTIAEEIHRTKEAAR